MNVWSRSVGIISVTIVFLSIFAFSQLSQFQETRKVADDDLRHQAAAAMRELKYQQALDLLEKLVSEGKAEFEDKNNVFICLEKLRKFSVLDTSINSFIDSEKNQFDKGRLLEWEVRRLLRQNQWRHKEEILALYKRANKLLADNARTMEQKKIFSSFLLQEMKVLTNQVRINDLSKIRTLAEKVVTLDSDDEIEAEALIIVAGVSENSRHDKDSYQVDVINSYRRITNKYEATSWAPKAQLRIAHLYNQWGQYLTALTELAKFAEHWTDTEEAKAASKLAESIKAPHIRVIVEEVFPAGSKPKIHLQYRNIKNIKFSTHKFELLSYILESKNIEHFVNSMEISPLPTDAEWNFNWNKPEDHAWRSEKIEVPLNNSGSYLLNATGGGVASRAILLISGLANLVKFSTDEALIYAADAKTGEPVNGAEILVASGAETKEMFIDAARKTKQSVNLFTQFVQGKTDDSGLYTAEFKGDKNYLPFVAIARKGDDYAISRDMLYYWNRSSQPEAKAFAYTDRPVYRPGQDVNFKAIVRNHFEGLYTPVANDPVQIVVYDARGNEITKQTLTTNEFGTISGSISLDGEAALGHWRLNVNYKDDQYTAGFRVEEYKKPEYQVTVETGESQYRLGSKIKIAINSKYFFGEPVIDAEVQYDIRQNRIGGYYWMEGPYDWFYSARQTRPSFGYGQIIHRGTGKTDAEGNLQLEIPSTALKDDDREAKAYSFAIDARVTDASRRQIKGSGSTIVTSHEFRSYIRADRYVYQPGAEAQLTISTSRYDGSKLATTGKMVLYQAEWNNKRSDYDLKKISEVNAQTDDNGTGTLRIGLEQEGYFFLQYECADAYDKIVTCRTGISVTSRNYRGKFFQTGTLQIIADKETYLKGDSAGLLINSTLDQAVGLLTVEADKILETRLVTLRQGANLVELTVTEKHQPNVFVKLHVIHGFALHTTQIELNVPPEEKFATLTVIPSKSEFKPGEKGSFRVIAKDWKGNPLSAEFSIGVIDASLYYFGEDSTPDIRKFFYANIRNDSIREANSFQFRFVGSEQESEEMDDTATFAAAAPTVAMESRVTKQRADKNEGGLVEPEIRSDFKDSALWLAHVTTGADGIGEVEIEWPDNLTTWRATARAVTKDTIVGNTKIDVITTKNLLVRLQTPRFLVQGDEVTLSVNVHNYLDSDKSALVKFEAVGLTLTGDLETTVTIPAGGETRVDVNAIAEASGTAKITASALTDEESDAMQLELPVLVHGIEKFDGAAGSVEGEKTIVLDLPERIQDGSANLRISVSPTIAGAMLDSLPYLIDYPYGCVEQTMSRFLPASVVAHALKKLGLERPELDEKIAKATNIGLKRLYDFQHGDGGWGWWKYGSSSPYMSAYVVFGLNLAKEIGLPVDTSSLQRGRTYLLNSLKGIEDQVETLNFVVFALSSGGEVPERYLNRIYDLLPRMKEYETSLFAVSLHNLGDGERYASVMKLVHELAQVNDRFGTASWGKDGGWYWYQDNVEATSLAMMAELRSDQKSDLAKKAARWLLSVRKGSKWKSTRDTAFAIYALTDFLTATEEFNPELTATVSLNGTELKSITFTKENMLSGDGFIEVPAAQLSPGKQSISIKTDGAGNLYYDAFMTYFSLEEPITAVGTTIEVARSYNKIRSEVDEKGQEQIHREKLKEGDALESGDVIEVELILKSENNYEYLVYEDCKPAGCEPVEIVSGRSWGNLASNMELRDEKVVFFIGWLPQGTHTIRYKLRAEIPGTFHTLPTNGYAMYSPDIRAISDEFVMPIQEKR